MLLIAMASPVALHLDHLIKTIMKEVLTAKDIRLSCAIVSTMMRTASAMTPGSTATTTPSSSTASDAAPNLTVGAGRRRRRSAARQRRKAADRHPPEQSDNDSYDDLEGDDDDYLKHMAEAARYLLREEEESKSAPPAPAPPEPISKPTPSASTPALPEREGGEQQQKHLAPTPAPCAHASDAEWRSESERLRQEMQSIPDRLSIACRGPRLTNLDMAQHGP